jgi:hypothetical protein
MREQLLAQIVTGGFFSFGGAPEEAPEKNSPGEQTISVSDPAGGVLLGNSEEIASSVCIVDRQERIYKNLVYARFNGALVYFEPTQM